MAAVADTAGDFVFEHRKFGGVLGELYYSGIAEAAGVSGVAWGLSSLILGGNRTSAVVGDMETALACRSHAEVLAVGGGYM